jgi:hypothetical protein
MRIFKQTSDVLTVRQKTWRRISVISFCWLLLISIEQASHFSCAAQQRTLSESSQSRNRQLAGIIAQEAAIARVDARLIWAIIRNESSFNQTAVSPKGAAGLMQLMPETAKRFGCTDRFNPRANIRAGASYLAYLLDYFNGNATLAIAAYNAGEGAVTKYGNSVPPYRETQEYVRRVSETFLSLISPAEIVFSKPAETVPRTSRRKNSVTATRYDVSKSAPPKPSSQQSESSKVNNTLSTEQTISTFLF